MEQERKDYAKRVLKMGLAVFVATSVILAIFLGWMMAEEATITALDLAVATVIFVVFVTVTVSFITPLWTNYTGIRGGYRAAYKAYFVEENLRRIFTEVEYNHEAGLAQSEVGWPGVLKLGDVFSSNDLTTGKYKDVSFVQADVHVQKKVESDDGEYYMTMFKGRWMIFEFPKAFRARLEVVERGFKNSKVAETNGRKFERIKVESEEFNRMFKVYAEDSVEGYYLLDPTMIEKMISIGEKYEGKLLMGFANNQLHVGLYDKKDAFEPPRNCFRALDERREQAKIAEEIRVVTDFVDGLRLDQKIFR